MGRRRGLPPLPRPLQHVHQEGTSYPSARSPGRYVMSFSTFTRKVRHVLQRVHQEGTPCSSPWSPGRYVMSFSTFTRKVRHVLQHVHQEGMYCHVLQRPSACHVLQRVHQEGTSCSSAWLPGRYVMFFTGNYITFFTCYQKRMLCSSHSPSR